jgi:hypothetical protein
MALGSRLHLCQQPAGPVQDRSVGRGAGVKSLHSYLSESSLPLRLIVLLLPSPKRILLTHLTACPTLKTPRTKVRDLDCVAERNTDYQPSLAPRPSLSLPSPHLLPWPSIRTARRNAHATQR